MSETNLFLMYIRNHFCRNPNPSRPIFNFKTRHLAEMKHHQHSLLAKEKKKHQLSEVFFFFIDHNAITLQAANLQNFTSQVPIFVSHPLIKTL